MTQTFFTHSATAWSEVSDFFVTQLTEGKRQHAFNWARIIDHAYLKGLSLKEHPFLATILAAIIEQRQGPWVWTAEWAKASNDMTDIKAIGTTIFKEASVPHGHTHEGHPLS